MADYAFLTTWLLDSPREPVWETIYAQEHWSEWWPGVEAAVAVDHGDGNRVGAVSQMAWRSFLPYRIHFELKTTAVERPYLMEGRVSGDLVGTGRWRFYQADGATAVLYEWNVATTKPWMNLAAPFARPIFRWNHDWVMARGGEGIAARLGCRLLASS